MSFLVGRVVGFRYLVLWWRSSGRSAMVQVVSHSFGSLGPIRVWLVLPLLRSQLPENLILETNLNLSWRKIPKNLNFGSPRSIYIARSHSVQVEVGVPCNWTLKSTCRKSASVSNQTPNFTWTECWRPFQCRHWHRRYAVCRPLFANRRQHLYGGCRCPI